MRGYMLLHILHISLMSCNMNESDCIRVEYRLPIRLHRPHNFMDLGLCAYIMYINIGLSRTPAHQQFAEYRSFENM